MCWLLRAIVDHERMVSIITVVGGCRSSVAEHWWLKPEALRSIPGSATFLSFPLPFQRSSDSNSPDYFWLDDLHRSLDCGGVPSIKMKSWCFRHFVKLKLPKLWLKDHLHFGLVFVSKQPKQAWVVLATQDFTAVSGICMHAGISWGNLYSEVGGSLVVIQLCSHHVVPC